MHGTAAGNIFLHICARHDVQVRVQDGYVSQANLHFTIAIIIQAGQEGCWNQAPCGGRSDLHMVEWWWFTSRQTRRKLISLFHFERLSKRDDFKINFWDSKDDWSYCNRISLGWVSLADARFNWFAMFDYFLCISIFYFYSNQNFTELIYIIIMSKLL